MKYKQIKIESPEGFRRLTGIKRTTFDAMVIILKQAKALLKAQGGKPNKLSIEDRLLMTLEIIGRQPEVSDAYKKGKLKTVKLVVPELIQKIREGGTTHLNTKHPINLN